MRPALPGCLLAVLASAGAGCLGGPAAGADEGMPAVGQAFPSVALRLGPGADAESAVAVSEDGQVVLVCAHGGFTQASPLWASVDGAKTFRRVEPQPNQPFNGDCDVSISPDGAWAIVYDTVASATVATSQDQGATWQVQFVSGLPLGGLDRPWVDYNGQGLFLVYKSVGAGQPTVHMFARSTDGGLTWANLPYYPARPPSRTESVAGDLFVADGGRTVYVPLAAGGYLDLAVSRDAGLTWDYVQAAGPLPIVGGIVTGSRAGDGTVYLAYTTPDSGVGDVMVVHSADDGATWSQPQPAATGVRFVGLVETAWIDARPDGSATVAWMGAADGAPDGEFGPALWQMQAARVNAEGPRLAVDFAGPVGPVGDETYLYEFPMVRHDGSGRAFIAFPQVTGPDCKQTPPFPSQVGSGDIPRNVQCQYLAVETGGGLPGLGLDAA